MKDKDRKRKQDPSTEDTSLHQEKQDDTLLDDGRTVAPMDAPWMPWNVHTGWKRRASSNKESDQMTDRGGEPSLTPAEKRAMLRGAFLAHLPLIAGTVIIGLLLYGLTALWLMPR